MSQEANQIIQKIQEVADEKLQASKQEHIFVERGLGRIKQIIEDLASQKEGDNAEEQSGSV